MLCMRTHTPLCHFAAEELQRSRAKHDQGRASALLAAAGRGDAREVAQRLERGVRADACGSSGRTALSVAAAAGHEVCATPS